VTNEGDAYFVSPSVAISSVPYAEMGPKGVARRRVTDTRTPESRTVDGNENRCGLPGRGIRRQLGVSPLEHPRAPTGVESLDMVGKSGPDELDGSLGGQSTAADTSRAICDQQHVSLSASHDCVTILAAPLLTDALRLPLHA